MQRFVTTILSVSLVVPGVGLGHISIASASPSTPVLAATEAPANDDDAYDALTEEAGLRYEKGDYAAAVALFKRAYEIRPEPNILFNIGRIQEEAGNLESAIENYEAFIQDTSADYEARQAALKRLTLLRELVNIKEREAEQSSQPTQPQPQPQPGQPQGQPVQGQPQPGQPQPAQQYPQQPEGPRNGQPVDTGSDGGPDPRTMRIVGYSLLGLGGLALIGGGIAAGVARNRHAQLEQAAPDIDMRREIEAGGINAARAADGMFIAGGLLAVSGVVILLLPQSRKKRRGDRNNRNRRNQRRTAVVPQVSGQEVGLGLVGRF